MYSKSHFTTSCAELIGTYQFISALVHSKRHQTKTSNTVARDKVRWPAFVEGMVRATLKMSRVSSMQDLTSLSILVFLAAKTAVAAWKNRNMQHGPGRPEENDAGCELHFGQPHATKPCLWSIPVFPQVSQEVSSSVEDFCMILSVIHLQGHKT